MSLLTRLLSEDTDVALDEAKKSCPVCGQRPCVKNAKCMEYKKHGTIDGKPTEIHTYGGKKKKKHEGTFEEALALLERKPDHSKAQKKLRAAQGFLKTALGAAHLKPDWRRSEQDFEELAHSRRAEYELNGAVDYFDGKDKQLIWGWISTLADVSRMIQNVGSTSYRPKDVNSWLTAVSRGVNSLLKSGPSEDDAADGEPLEEAKTTALVWEFKKKPSAKKFYEMVRAIEGREDDPDWSSKLSRDGFKVMVSGMGSSSGTAAIPSGLAQKLDNLASAHKGRKTNSQTEDADDAEGEQLDEMFIGRQMRYVDPQELQYTLEDAATACERNWSERKGHRDMKTLQAPHEALVKSLRAAAAKAGEYATVYKRRMDEL